MLAAWRPVVVVVARWLWVFAGVVLKCGIAGDGGVVMVVVEAVMGVHGGVVMVLVVTVRGVHGGDFR